MAREEWAHWRTGEENDPAVADADRAEHREAVFGQTCPIETAVDVPVRKLEGIGQWLHLAATGWERPAGFPANLRLRIWHIID
ncbi:hypothetical protein HB780_01215 (plasmid) [Rhizobium lusitanum]|uniref:hypothetical protein n=1 Tax=Rhizobium lusitanum TaxID=293958 RepID=UPI001621C019|nr:hypothetical protein [Rhizobium lusitanum]QND44450.1 hypothetical protein HB780_01215 [Rhizobium lusitanum]